MSLDVLFFEVRGRRCALPISVVREVLAAPAITPVPMAPATLRGLVPVHGHVLPLIDIGPHLAGAPSEAAASAPLRWDGDRIIVVEAPLALPQKDWPPEGADSSTGHRSTVRAALVAHRVTRLGSLDESHSRPPPAGPSFVSATVLDLEGPAFLIDAAGAMQTLRQSLRAAVAGAVA